MPEKTPGLSSFTLIPELDVAIVVLGNTTALGDANELVMHVLSSQVLNSGAPVDYKDLATRVSNQCKDWHLCRTTSASTPVLSMPSELQ
jgi:hypothetical protein